MARASFQVIAILFFLIPVRSTIVFGQTKTDSLDASAEDAEGLWSFSGSLYLYLIADDTDFLLPIVTADHDRLHLEARYNYEDRKTGSVWAGYNLGGERTISWELTPMFGFVFGNTTGVAPGLEAWLGWWMLEFYIESEYVVETGEGTENFLYHWSEFSVLPVEYLRVGVVAQRTRAYETERDVQRGFLAGVTIGQFGLTGFIFNPDMSPTVIISCELSL